LLDYFKKVAKSATTSKEKKRVANVLACLAHDIKACGIAGAPCSNEKKPLLVGGTTDPITIFSKVETTPG